MRRWVKIAIPSLLLAVGVVICALRWQAWFGMPAEPRWNGDTLDYTFPSPSNSVSAQTSNSPKDVQTILVLGDIHNGLTQADYDTLAARVPHIDLIAQTGDWMERGQNYFYQLLLREWTNSRLYGLPVVATPGNHEYSKGLPKQLSPVWEQAFTRPDNGPVNVPGASYYVDIPQMRIITIDTNPLDRLVYLTRTLTWLRTVMSSAGDRYVVVLMHHPVLSVGKGRFNALVYATFRHALGQADLVIAGHDHSYMRRTPFVVLNTAGRAKEQHPLYSPDVTDTVPVYGVLKSEITNHKSQMSFHVYRLDNGEMIDSLYVNHD